MSQAGDEALEGEEERGEGIPLVIEGTDERATVGEAGSAAVPVVSVEMITLFAVKISMNAGSFGSVDVLRDGVGLLPVAVSIMPQRVQEWRKIGGF